jgi:hypothetical protein
MAPSDIVKVDSEGTSPAQITSKTAITYAITETQKNLIKI